MRRWSETGSPLPRLEDLGEAWEGEGRVIRPQGEGPGHGPQTARQHGLRKADRFSLVHPNTLVPKDLEAYMDLFKPPNSPFPEQRVPVTSPPASGGFGDLLGSGPRLSQTPHPWLLPLGACRACRRLQTPRTPLRVLPSVDWKGAAEATVSSGIRNLSYTAPSPAERWVQLCSAGSLRLGAQPGPHRRHFQKRAGGGAECLAVWSLRRARTAGRLETGFPFTSRTRATT